MAAISTPAAARDHSGYVAFDAGLMWSKSSVGSDFTDSYYICNDYFQTYFSDCHLGIGSKNKMGYDVDFRGGYDFGMFRLEGELAYKHANRKSDSFLSDELNIDTGGKTTNWSLMLNGLFDFGSDDGVNFSVGAGIGWAKTKHRFDLDAGFNYDGEYYFDNLGGSLSKSKFAWQLLAEMRYPVSPQVDIGLKYRYFNAGKISRSFSDDFGGFFDASAKFHSHSLLLGLTYNFAPPPPPPPPPPSAASAASGDADMPGRVGDRSDGDLPGTASASAATSGDAGRTRPVKAASRKGSGARRATVSPLSFEALRSAISLSEARSILRQPTGCSNRVRHLDCYATWAVYRSGLSPPIPEARDRAIA